MKEKKPIKFDDYADSYQRSIQAAINYIGQEVDFFTAIKAELVKKIAEEYFHDQHNIKILDIGCGIGLTDMKLKEHFHNLYGADIEEKVIQKAKANNPEVKYFLYDGRKLPFDDNKFDMAFTINVMHHVKHNDHPEFISEMKRVIKPMGIAAVFEHNPYNPHTRRVVRDCEFDRDAVLLKPSYLKELMSIPGLSVKEKAFIIFLPFKGSFYRKFERAIKWLGLGAQYYITAIKK